MVGEVVGCHEVGKIRSEFVMAFVRETFARRFLDCAVHAFDLAVDPGVVRFGEPERPRRISLT